MKRWAWVTWALAVASGVALAAETGVAPAAASAAAPAATGASAAAGWVSIGDQGAAEVFVDKSTITRAGDTAKMWSLQELKTPGSAGGAAYVSLKRQDEFDCKNPRTRGVQISAHPQPKGEGKAVASEKGSGAWSSVVPGSTNEVLWKIACGKE